MMPSWISLYCLLAGVCDAATGVLLVNAPYSTLRILGIGALPAEPIYLRFVGVFVGAVGLMYLYPFLSGEARCAVRLRVVLESTALVRFLVALFLAVALVSGHLTLPWVSVLLTDFVLASAQLWMLRQLELGV